LFAEVSNRSHAGKAVANLNTLNYNYNLSKFSATYPSFIVLTIFLIVGCQSSLDIEKQPTKEDIVNLIYNSEEFESLVSNLEHQRINIKSRIIRLSKEQRINLKESLKLHKINPGEQIENTILKIAEIDSTILLRDNISSIYNKLYNKLISSGASHDLIRQSWGDIDFGLNIQNSSLRTSRSEYDYCINQSYYYLSLAVMDCFAGPSSDQNWCIGIAELHHIAYMLHCIADCSMENPQLC
jgi:hypothetical protein